MKTTNDILTVIYKIVKASLIDDLNGGVYKVTRPTDSKLQDCIISLISGQSEKFIQTGAVYVKIFFSDLFINNTHTQDFVTGSIMETLLYDLSLSLFKIKGYSFDIQSREIYSEALQETNEHYSILKINFKSLL